MKSKTPELETLRVIPRIADADAVAVWCTGGVRIGRVDEEVWYLEPVLRSSQPTTVGYFTKLEVNREVARLKLRQIAFEDMGWHNGVYHTSWRPILYNRQNHSVRPADLWGRIHSNFSKARVDFENMDPKSITHEQMFAIFDARPHEERLSLLISLSIRSIDQCIQGICEFYHERLVDLLSSKHKVGSLYGNTRDHSLYSLVHSALLHFGSARDYLSSLISYRLGLNPNKTDSFAKLLPFIHEKQIAQDGMIKVLLKCNAIEMIEGKVSQSGWLQDLTKLRNRVVHQSPFGELFKERFGTLAVVDKEIGLFTYHHPIVLSNDLESDVLEFLSELYHSFSSAFFELAESTGYDQTMLNLTANDVISI